MLLGPSMCYLCFFTLKLFPTDPVVERMECPPVITQCTFTCEMPFTDATIRMACRFLMLVECVIEVKPLIAVRATEVMKGITVALEPQGGTEEAVAVTAETVACGAFVVF